MAAALRADTLTELFFKSFLSFEQELFFLHKRPMQHLQVDFNLILGGNRWYRWLCLIADLLLPLPLPLPPPAFPTAVFDDLQLLCIRATRRHSSQNLCNNKIYTTCHDYRKRRHVAATKIQALWRGWYIRHLIDVNTTKVGKQTKIDNVNQTE